MVLETTLIRLRSCSRSIEYLFNKKSSRVPRILTLEGGDKVRTFTLPKLIRKGYAEELYQLTLVSGHHIIADDRTLILTSDGWVRPSKFRDMKGHHYCPVINKRPKLVFFDGKKFIQAYLTSVQRHYDRFVYELETDNPDSCLVANGFVVRFIKE